MQHPGFKAVQSEIAKKERIPMKDAGAILASSTRKASAKARSTNPALGKVLGGTPPGRPHPHRAVSKKQR